MPTLKRLAPYLIILFAFAARIYALDTTYVDGDRANPHGMALLMVNQVSRGQFTDLLLFADVVYRHPQWPGRKLRMGRRFALRKVAAVRNRVWPDGKCVCRGRRYALGRSCFDWTTGIIEVS